MSLENTSIFKILVQVSCMSSLLSFTLKLSYLQNKGLKDLEEELVKSAEEWTVRAEVEALI